MDPIVPAIATAAYALILLALVSRISHWSHQTQLKIEQTNKLLQELVTIETKKGGSTER